VIPTLVCLISTIHLDVMKKTVFMYDMDIHVLLIQQLLSPGVFQYVQMELELREQMRNVIMGCHW